MQDYQSPECLHGLVNTASKQNATSPTAYPLKAIMRALQIGFGVMLFATEKASYYSVPSLRKKPPLPGYLSDGQCNSGPQRYLGHKETRERHYQVCACTPYVRCRSTTLPLLKFTNSNRKKVIFVYR